MKTFRSKIYGAITEAIGATPLVRLPKMSISPNGERLPGILLGKLESFNPAGSVKCRIGAAILEADKRKYRHRARVFLRVPRLQAYTYNA